MSVSLEDRLIESLRDRAERLAPPRPGLADDVIRRGRRVRRRRRITAAACAISLVAGAAVALHAVRTDQRSLEDSFATSVDPIALDEGPASLVPYMVGSVLVDDAGRFDLPWPGLQIRSVWEISDGYLVEASGPDTTSVLEMSRATGDAVELASGVRDLVVSSDGMQFAWKSIVRPRVSVTDRYGEETVHYPVLPPDLRVVGFVDDERGYQLDLLLQPDDGGPISVWDFRTNAVESTGLSGLLLDVRSEDVTLASIDGCLTVLDGSWTERWRDCALVPDRGAVSPDGSRVAVLGGDGSVVIRRAADGATIHSFSVTNGVAGEVRWEDDTHIVMTLTPAGGDPRVARCDVLSGECEWAGPLPPASAAEGADADLILGYRAFPE